MKLFPNSNISAREMRAIERFLERRDADTVSLEELEILVMEIDLLQTSVVDAEATVAKAEDASLLLGKELAKLEGDEKRMRGAKRILKTQKEQEQEQEQNAEAKAELEENICVARVVYKELSAEIKDGKKRHDNLRSMFEESVARLESLMTSLEKARSKANSVFDGPRLFELSQTYNLDNAINSAEKNFIKATQNYRHHRRLVNDLRRLGFPTGYIRCENQRRFSI